MTKEHVPVQPAGTLVPPIPFLTNLLGSTLAPPSRAAASRFLAQATFGPSATDITELVRLGYADWIQTQVALPATSHLARFKATKSKSTMPEMRQEAWWWAAITAPDQLRQRVAFALSEILVVSDLGTGLSTAADGLAAFYDLLVANAFGSFRTLLGAVTLHPTMGQWLSLAGSVKANAAKGTHPDENYARELMQLFTLGTVRLHQDGTPIRDASGATIASYTQDDVTEAARALTGWDLDGKNNDPWKNPMYLDPSKHDAGAKTVLGTSLTGGAGQVDLGQLLDVLVAHPNTAPFISTLLIQRLVTSNPTPGYVARVAAVFANDGTGARGNLGAVVTAILLDAEARNGAAALGPSFGKVREPLLRMTHLWRAMDGGTTSGRFLFPDAEVWLGQAALRASSVFGFFSPGYAPKPLASAGLLAPELQLANDVSLPQADDLLWSSVNLQTQAPAVIGKVLGIAGGQNQALSGAHNIKCDLSSLQSQASNPAALVATLDEIFTGGQLGADVTSRIASYLSTIPSTSQRATEAVYLVLASPAYLVQR